MPEERLAGRRVLLTGASSGIGHAAVAAFAREGARLAITARSAPALRQAAAAAGGRRSIAVLPADLADREQALDVVARAEEVLGGLDVVVANHGVAMHGHFLEVHPDDFERVLAVTFGGTVNLMRAALPALRRSRGTFVATGSLNTRVPLPTFSSYAAAKHALRGFLGTIRVEEAEQRSGVQIAMVHPGPVDTPLWAHGSSATGRKPRVPPDSYRPEVLAQALVETAIAPRREVLVGSETVAADRLFSLATPVGEALLRLVDRWYRSGDAPADVPGTLHDAPPLRGSSGGVPSRDSLLAPLQLGRRLLPSPMTPVALARNLGLAAIRAAQLRRTLAHPTPETSGPAQAVRHQADPRDQPRRRGRAEV